MAVIYPKYLLAQDKLDDMPAHEVKAYLSRLLNMADNAYHLNGVPNELIAEINRISAELVSRYLLSKF